MDARAVAGRTRSTHPFALAIACAVAVTAACRPGSTSPSGTAMGGCSGSGPPTFSVHITDLTRIALIVPPGALSGNSIKPHSHFRTDGGAVPLRAPADMTLTQGTWIGASNDYLLFFTINCDFRLSLGHVTDPVASIASLISRSDPGSTLADVGPLTLRAGDLLGQSSGTSEVNGIDFGLYDMRVEADTPNAATYRDRGYWTLLHAVCPYESFDASLRSGYFARFGSVTGLPVPGGPCRVLSDQVADGTVSGEWFLTSHTPDGVYQEQMAVGTTLDGGTVRVAGIDGMLDAAGGPDPKTVTGEVCYSAGGRYVFLRMGSTATLDAIHGTGACPGVFPSGAHRTYRR